jgi:putative membrane protein
MRPTHVLLIGALLAAGCQDNDRDSMSSRTGARGQSLSASDGKMANPGTLSKADQQFVVNAASGGMFELQSSQMALSRLNDATEKAFAQQMINDHTKVNNELATLVTRKGGSVPTQMLPRHQKMLDTLSEANSEEFLKAYHRRQVAAHDEAINLFEGAAKAVDDADLRAFAAKNLSALKMHKDMLKDHNH